MCFLSEALSLKTLAQVSKWHLKVLAVFWLPILRPLWDLILLPRFSVLFPSLVRVVPRILRLDPLFSLSVFFEARPVVKVLPVAGLV